MHEVHVRVLVSCKGYSSEWKEQTYTLEAAVMCTRVIGDKQENYVSIANVAQLSVLK